LAVQHIDQLTKAATKAKNALTENQRSEREAVALSTKILVEYIATTKKMPVTSVVRDYEDLVYNWRTVNPACRIDLQCPMPADAALRALAVRKPR
jgi:hypothetical protein